MYHSLKIHTFVSENDQNAYICVWKLPKFIHFLIKINKNSEKFSPQHFCFVYVSMARLSSCCMEFFTRNICSISDSLVTTYVYIIQLNVANSTSDAMRFNMLGETEETKYGAQRVWDTIGFGLPLIGFGHIYVCSRRTIKA